MQPTPSDQPRRAAQVGRDFMATLRRTNARFTRRAEFLAGQAVHNLIGGMRLRHQIKGSAKRRGESGKTRCGSELLKVSPANRRRLRSVAGGRQKVSSGNSWFVVVRYVSATPLRPRHPEQSEPAGRAYRRRSRSGFACAHRTRVAMPTPNKMSGKRPCHGVRRGGLPEHRRVLGQEARHLHDHGWNTCHPRLRLLNQRQARHCTARSMPSSRNTSRRYLQLGLARNNRITSGLGSRDDPPMGGAEHFAQTIPRDPCALPNHRPSRSLTPRFPAQGRWRLKSWWRRKAGRVQPQSGNGALALSNVVWRP